MIGDMNINTPATVNDPGCAERVRQLAGEIMGADALWPGYVPLMASEDFLILLSKFLLPTSCLVQATSSIKCPVIIHALILMMPYLCHGFLYRLH